MIIGGAAFAAAGASFFAPADGDDPTVADLAGCTFAGGVFFLVPALRPNRARDGV
jgi:hypothetical protein